MNILDIHTHRHSIEAIRNLAPGKFQPEEGYFYSAGIHPWDITPNYEDELQLLRHIAPHPQIVAIGETGLDKLKGPAPELQTHLFKLQASIAEEQQKPVIAHSVRSSNELIQLKKELRPTVAWIIHGFRGNSNIAHRLLNAGFYLSYGEKYQIESLRNTPIHRLFIESDESETDIADIYRNIARDLSLPTEELQHQIGLNIKEVFF